MVAKKGSSDPARSEGGRRQRAYHSITLNLSDFVAKAFGKETAPKGGAVPTSAIRYPQQPQGQQSPEHPGQSQRSISNPPKEGTYQEYLIDSRCQGVNGYFPSSCEHPAGQIAELALPDVLPRQR
jgi:hypothetical protein